LIPGVLLSILHTSSIWAQDIQLSTDSLVRQFHEAWNGEDMELMYDLLDDNAFFKSPFQLRYTRDSMKATVLKTNPPVFKVIEQIESESKCKGNLAWSIGKMVCDVYDENGKKEKDQWHNDYVYMFVKRDDHWKLQMLFFHE
jgi:ketosteroid isomerase-like protein